MVTQIMQRKKMKKMMTGLMVSHLISYFLTLLPKSCRGYNEHVLCLSS